MTGNFALLDLPSQSLVVERLLWGRPEVEKLAWLGAHGKVEPIARIAAPRTYLFESTLGMRCVFLLAGDAIVFIGDNTTYAVKAERLTSGCGGSGHAEPPVRLVRLEHEKKRR